MYAEFYGLREPPFNITPDPRFLYLNDCYQEALAALAYGIDARKGFVSLVGEAGTGKTTLLRRLLDTVGAGTRTVLLLNPTVSFEEILEHILLELGVPPDGGRKLVLLQRLNEFLIEHTAAGGNVALLIDEAQDLRPEVLEELRLLSNLETAREKILQIVLAGQPELDTMLADRSLRQLRQRVTLRVRIRPLTTAEVVVYIRTRLERAGGTAELFGADALARVATLSQGIPRLVNVLCDAALLAAFAAGARVVTAAIVDEAWRDYTVDVPLVEPLLPPAVTAAPPVTTPPPAPVVAPAPPEASPPPTPPAVEPVEVAAAPPLEIPVTIPAAPPRDPEAVAPDRPPRRGPVFPVAAAFIAVVAVALSIVKVEVDRVRHDDDDQPVATAPAPAPALASTDEATAAEPPADAAPPDAVVGARPAPPLSSGEAAAVVDAFRAAYEARDVDRLLGLFAPDASENGVRGLDAIASLYRAELPAMSDVRYSLPRFSIEPHGDRADVRGPFVIAYRKDDGAAGEIRGQAEWELARRDGAVRIVALNYRLDPEG
jgi:general secretion pathway protein A